MKIVRNNKIVPIMEMATVYRSDDDNFFIAVNPDGKHIGDAYFKFYNHKSYLSATKVIRISFLEPKYIFHTNEDGKEDWILGRREKEKLMKYLPMESNLYCKELERYYTVWEKAIYLYNYEFGYSEKDKEYLPLNIKIPNYNNL